MKEDTILEEYKITKEIRRLKKRNTPNNRSYIRQLEILLNMVIGDNDEVYIKTGGIR